MEFKNYVEILVKTGLVDRCFGRALSYRGLPDGQASIDHFTVVCLVSWPSNEGEAGVGLLPIETSVLFFC